MTPTKNQHPDILQSGSLIVPDQHLIRRRRNHRHLGFLKPCFQNFLVIRKGDRLVSQDLHQFVQQFHDNPVDLGIFPGHRRLPALLEHLLLPLQLSLALIFHNKRIERFCLKENRGSPLFHSLRKRLHFPEKAAPQFIDMQQRFRLHAAVAPGPGFPVPLKSTDSQSDHIIFQFVGLLPGKASHAAPEVTKHRLAGKILNNQIQRCPEEFHKGIHQHRMFLVDKARNPRLPEDLPGVSGVRRKIPGKHCDITVTISVHTDQFMNFCRHRPQLLLGIHHHADRQFSFRISAPLIPVIAVQILLQKIQRASILKPAVFSPLRPDLRKHLTVYFMGAVQKLPHHLSAGEKQILGAGASHRIFPLINRHCHQELRAERHQFFQHLQLDRRKSHKTIKKNFAGPDLLRLLQPDGQNLENPFRRHVAVPQIFLERLINTADILQFQRQQRFCLCPFSPELQILSRHLILHQLRNQRFSSFVTAPCLFRFWPSTFRFFSCS